MQEEAAPSREASPRDGSPADGSAAEGPAPGRKRYHSPIVWGSPSSKAARKEGAGPGPGPSSGAAGAGLSLADRLAREREEFEAAQRVIRKSLVLVLLACDAHLEGPDL